MMKSSFSINQLSVRGSELRMSVSPPPSPRGPAVLLLLLLLSGGSRWTPNGVSAAIIFCLPTASLLFCITHFTTVVFRLWLVSDLHEQRDCGWVQPGEGRRRTGPHAEVVSDVLSPR